MIGICKALGGYVSVPLGLGLGMVLLAVGGERSGGRGAGGAAEARSSPGGRPEVYFGWSWSLCPRADHGRVLGCRYPADAWRYHESIAQVRKQRPRQVESQELNQV